MIDRLPPHSEEAEQAVIGLLIEDPSISLSQAQSTLPGFEAFYDVRHQQIYKALCRIVDAGKKIELQTLHIELKQSGELESSGGLAYIGELANNTPSPVIISQLLETLLDQLTLRRMIHLCVDTVNRAYESGHHSDELIERFEQETMALRIRQTGRIRSMKELVKDAVDRIEKAHQSQGKISGISSGFTDLDNLTDGWHSGELIVIGGVTSSGKTTLALNMVEHAVLKQGIPSGIFSLEMSAESLATRMLCSCSRVNIRAVAKGYLVQRDIPKITNAAGPLSRARLYIDDDGGTTIGQVRAKARRMVQLYGVRMIIVDYLQLLSCPEIRKRDNREQEVASISKGLKGMARELNLPVIALSQLNDEGQLRESRAIAQDADVIAKIELDGPRAALRISKQRNGPAQVSINLVWLKEFTRFETASNDTGRDSSS